MPPCAMSIAMYGRRYGGMPGPAYMNVCIGLFYPVHRLFNEPLGPPFLGNGNFNLMAMGGHFFLFFEAQAKPGLQKNEDESVIIMVVTMRNSLRMLKIG